MSIARYRGRQRADPMLWLSLTFLGVLATASALAVAVKQTLIDDARSATEGYF